MSTADNIKVFVRIRPLNKREALEDPKGIIYTDKEQPLSLLVDSKDNKTDPKAFNFDWIAGESSSQEDIFEVIGKPMTEAYIQGYNCCIFAYGQTGAGKTYTMQGRGLEFGSKDEIHRGLQPRIIDRIFAMIAKDKEENPERQYSVKCGYLEIYNEQIMDLFNPTQGTLKKREDLKKGVYIEDLTEIETEDSATTINFIRQGSLNRHTGSTDMNQESSRSHSLFIMTVQRKTPTAIFTSKFNFVDLAGSERQKQTNTTGILFKEAAHINQSLSTLGLVINNLVEAAEGKAKHITYRDSKLTFILRDSLGGNSKTCLLANVSPANSSLQDTISTLKFAQRAKQIKNNALINKSLSEDMAELKRENEELKKKLRVYQQLDLQHQIPNPIFEESKESEQIGDNNLLLDQQDFQASGTLADPAASYYHFLAIEILKLRTVKEKIQWRVDTELWAQRNGPKLRYDLDPAQLKQLIPSPHKKRSKSPKKQTRIRARYLQANLLFTTFQNFRKDQTLILALEFPLVYKVSKTSVDIILFCNKEIEVAPLVTWFCLSGQKIAPLVNIQNLTQRQFFKKLKQEYNEIPEREEMETEIDCTFDSFEETTYSNGKRRRGAINGIKATKTA